MDGWVRQPGYPLISLSRQQQPGYIAAQQRFFEHGEEPADPTLWQVPIGLRALESASASSTQTQASQTDLLTSKSAALTAATSHPESFILANAGGVGYYRTRYPVESYSELINSLAQSTDPAERLAVLDDTWTLAKTGDLGIDTYLNMITALRSEKDEMVWTQMISQLETVDYFVDAQTRPAFEKFVRAQLQPIAKSLGWQARAGELQQTRMLRGRILTALGTFGNDTEVIARARKLFNQARRPDASSKGTAIIETDLREPISRIVAYNGTAADFDYIKRLSDQASTPEIYISNLLVLARFRDPALVDRALSMSVSGKLRNQDAPNLLGIVLSRRDANRHAWEFIEAHWAQITSLYPEEMVPRVVARAASFNTLPDYQRVKAFVSTHRIKSGTSTVARMLEHVEINVRFRNTAAARLNDWLKQHYGNV
jgi:aminopeptidase N